MTAGQAAERPGAEGAEAKAAFLLRLRSMGVRTTAILRAMEMVPREAFLDARHAPFAPLDIALPIGCGQSAAEPSFVARQLEGLACSPASRVLEIGSGSGYVTALLAQLAGEVQGFERYRSLAEVAQARLHALGIANARVDWADGLEPGAARAGFDRVLLHVAVPAPPPALLDGLASGAIMVCPLTTEGRQDLVQFRRGGEGSITAVRLCTGRLQAAIAGRSQVL
jgi:protein-L-isoaspartate(D-aspartate) O-methyltransferase